MATRDDRKRWARAFVIGSLERDGNKCVFCDSTKSITVYHISGCYDLPNGAYSVSNGISVCPKHRNLCTSYHGTGKYIPEYHPRELYKLINSSIENARKDCINLV